MNPIRIILPSLLLLAACKGPAFLEQRTDADRPDYGDDRIVVPPPPPPPHIEIINPDPVKSGGAPPEIETVITGTWTSTTPPTVTRVQKRTESMDQFSLYNGRPAPTDTPFLVITVTRDRRGIAELDSATYKISGQRDYDLNGQTAHEWTGNLASGAAFCELVVAKRGDNTGDVCHAMAIAHNAEEQQLSLSILASIVWAGR